MIILLLIILFPLACSATIIPDDRRVQWQGNVGVPGGITNRSTIFCNVLVSIPGTNRVATGNGTTDDGVALQTALNLCPAGQVVYLPAATYVCSNNLVFKSSCTLRGDGPQLTIINSFVVNDSIALGANGSGSYDRYNNFNGAAVTTTITGGSNLGSSNITVTSASGISVGNLLNIDMINDTNGNIGISPVGNEGPQNTYQRISGSMSYALGQVVYITAINGNSISFDPPLAWWFTNSPVATAFTCLRTYGGVEGMTIYNNNTGANAIISMSSVAYCWITNVETAWCDGDHVIFDASTRCQIQHSYLHDAYIHSAGTHDQCLKMIGHSSGILVENNMMRRLHVSMMCQAGGQGSVVAYNWMTNTWDSGNTGFMFSDFTTHGAHTLMCLLEGNVMNGFAQDGDWGTSSHVTLLRNYISGVDNFNPPATGRSAETGPVTKQTSGNISINLAGFGNSKFFNVVGNVLGSTNMGNIPSFSPVYMATAPTPIANGPGYVWLLGYSADDGSNPNDNTDPLTTLINHGNWDALSNSQMFSNNIPDHVIPASYYLPGKPSWFGTLTWPPVEPSLGTNWQSTPYLIPAQERFFTGQDPPSSAVPPSLTVSGQLNVSGTLRVGQ